MLKSLAETEAEATGSMGDDTPIAAMSRQSRPLFDYFRQGFAQVTNPPIDPLRERLVMSLTTQIGLEGNVFELVARERETGAAQLADPVAAQVAPDSGAAADCADDTSEHRSVLRTRRTASRRRCAVLRRGRGSACAAARC